MRIREYISNHVFQIVFVVTTILLIVDLTNISTRIPLLNNISDRYDWLGYFGAIIGVYVTIKVFENTLANDRLKREESEKNNQNLMSEERRLNNKPILIVRSLTFNEMIDVFNSSKQENRDLIDKIGITDSVVVTDQNNYIEQNSINKVLYLELKNVGLNHAIINSYKINNEETQELIPIHTKVIVRRDQCGYLTVTFSDSEFENNRFNIYYTDIFDNCYMAQFSLDGGEFKQSTNKLKNYVGKVKQIVLSKYESKRSKVNNDLN